MPDLIADFCERMLALDPNIDVRMADRLCHDLRNDWGGQRVYIARNPGGHQTELRLRLGSLSADGVSRWTRRRRL
jgi:hypothetical protein